MPESKEPLLTGLEKILSTKEAVALLKNHESYTSNVLDMHKAPSGTEWLFKSQSKKLETGDTLVTIFGRLVEPLL